MEYSYSDQNSEARNCIVEENSEDVGRARLRDEIAVSIDEIILQIKHVSDIPYECIIYRIPKDIRDANPDAYTPQIISIGPLHHGKKELMPMEACKRAYLKCFLSRIENYLSLNQIIEKVMDLEERVRNCYVEPIEMKSAKFVELLMVDACFIVEFLLSVKDDEFSSLSSVSIRQKKSSYYLLTDINMSLILYDLIKLENQLPFFLLQMLYDLYYKSSNSNNLETISFSELVHVYFCFSGFFEEEQNNPVKTDDEMDKIGHFVEFLSLYFNKPHTSAAASSSSSNPPEENNQYAAEISLSCPTATQLERVGVTFKKAEGKGFFDIITRTKFRNGVFEIPRIEIFDETEIYMRNVIAYEEGCCTPQNRIMTQFIFLMDKLIVTEKDASKLIQAGIISNSIGHTEEVSKLFNKIGKGVGDIKKTHLDNEYKNINEYMVKRRHTLMASLKRDYFNTPWAFISFLGATLLLLFTLIQTIFSGISIKK